MLILIPLLFACSGKSADETGDTGGDAVAAPTFEGEALWSDADDWEPSIAASGDDVYQITTRIGSDWARIVVRHSADAGVTWGDDVVLNPPRTDGYDPQIAVAPDVGCVIASWLDGDWATWVQRSCDDGATWSEPVAIAPTTGWTDHGWLLVSPDGEEVSLAYGGELEGDADDILASDHGYVVTSHDGGLSFDTPVDVGGDIDPDHYWFTSFGARDADGVLYYTAELYGSDYHGTTDLWLWRSSDGGFTWDTAFIASSEESPDCDWAEGCEYGYLASQAAVAVDVEGTVLVVWHGGGTADAPQALYAATTSAETWPSFSSPLLLSEGGDHAFPMATSGPAVGDLRLIYMADLDGGGTPWNTWYQQSADGGKTWLDAPVRLSDRKDGADYKSADGYTFPYGDYNGIAVDGSGRTHLIWGEGPSWTGPGGTWYTRSE